MRLTETSEIVARSHGKVAPMNHQVQLAGQHIGDLLRGSRDIATAVAVQHKNGMKHFEIIRLIW